MIGGIARRVGLALALCVFVLGACSPIVRNHGYVPSDEDLSLITVGVDTRETVAQSIGAPSAGGVMNGSGFYYVRSRWETRGFRAPDEADRQVVAVTFDEDGVVENIERFGLERGRMITLSRRVTDNSIRNISFIRQLLGNVGRIRADQFVE